jgi:pyruvate dehydrogenase E2 component (dihydrolipoamide acetyltransferase)
VTRQVRATPAVRRIARELGINLDLVTGTGPDGKISEEDVRSFAAARGGALAGATMAATSPEPVEWVDLSTVQRLTGERMVQSIQTAPQFALAISADMTNALQLRESLIDQFVAETGERPSITVLLVKIVATALKNQPRANASFEARRVKLHKRVNVGVAIGADAGLIVPVIKEADQKSLVQIARELQVFREKARQMRFSADDLSGGTFTISNLGMYGIDQFNAIVNPPQSAILAVGRVINTPVALPDNTVTPCPMMNLTLTVDHRAMDGVQGAKFLAEIKERLEKPDLLRDLGKV